MLQKGVWAEKHVELVLDTSIPVHSFGVETGCKVLLTIQNF